MIVPEHIWLTKDGRWVKTGNVEAETLLYPKGTEIHDDEWKKLTTEQKQLVKQAENK